MSIQQKSANQIHSPMRAPWMGAEENWRCGYVAADNIAAEWSEKSGLKGEPLAGLELRDDELQTVRTTFPPPPEMDLPKQSGAWAKMTGVAVLTGVLAMGAWVVIPKLGGDRLDTATSRILLEQKLSDGGNPTPMSLAYLHGASRDSAAEKEALYDGQSIEFSLSEVADWQRRASSAHARHRKVIGEATVGPNDASLPIAQVSVSVPDEQESASPSDEQVAALGESVPAETNETGSLVGEAPAAPTYSAELQRLNTLLAAEVAAEKPVAAQRATSSLPPRNAVKDAMKRVAPQVERCRISDSGKDSGKLIVKVVVAGNTGRVVSSQVIDNTFRGTSTGLCAARAVRNVKLPSFQQDKLTIMYPFVI